MIKIELEDRNARSAFEQLEAKARDPTLLMREIAEHLLESTQQRFRTGQAPDGTKWNPVKRGGTPLYLTGELQSQLYPFHGRDHAGVASPTAYASHHQYGTSPYQIRPKNKKALAWPGGAHPVRGVNHPGLVARPFMGLSDEDRTAIEAIAGYYLEDLE